MSLLRMKLAIFPVGPTCAHPAAANSSQTHEPQLQTAPADQAACTRAVGSDVVFGHSPAPTKDEKEEKDPKERALELEAIIG